MKSITKIFATTLCGLLFVSCGDKFMEDAVSTAYLNSEMATELTTSDPEALNSYLRGAFSYLVQFDITGAASHDDFSFMSVLHSTDMMGQDIALSGFHWFGYDYAHDNHEFNYRRTLVDWLTFYTIISKANEIIDLFPVEPETADAKGILAHGYALRGFAYYYLIQLYQHPVKEDGTVNWDAPGVPMRYSSVDGLSDEEIEKRKGRNTLRMVYEQIESDLSKAATLFEGGYTRPNKNYLDASVAYGLLARYYLLSQQWEKAAEFAKKAYSGYALNDYVNDGFYDINNSEWMWGFDHSTETQTAYASFFSHISNIAPGYAGLAYSSRLVDKALYESIPENDKRKAWFNGPEGDPNQSTAGAQLPYANVKFGAVSDWTMDYMYMRAPEMYLIEAEALAQQGKESEAAAALKPLMNVRVIAWSKTSMSVEDIYQQRRIELWGEGFSFFDLKRLNKGINRNYSGNNHLTGYQLAVPARAKTWIYQIPQREMQENSALKASDQNE